MCPRACRGDRRWRGALAELALVLRDIGMDSEQIMKVNPEQKLDREEFCEFLKIEWAGA